MNELSLETSPYLLQHAQNPVHWKAWNTNSLAQAKEKNQLIIISIGYAACHWCHVMEHESFENVEVAKTMNANFISIKVDREERPDVDAVYMKAVQIMSGHGGWPLNIVALPDGRPVWGGTYFRRNEWTNTLEQLQELYKTNPEKIIDYAEKLHSAIESLHPQNSNAEDFTSFVGGPEGWDGKNIDIINTLVTKWTKSFDLEFGGMARSPKFMMPNNYHFLMRFGYQTNNTEILDFVNLTLTKMAFGGIFDTVGGGFSRYSVDMKWHVPHFEKMLYDNGQLVSLYADAFKLTKIPLYKEIVEKTLDFVSRELSNAKGGFFCALDADSLNNKSVLEEGAFYVWQKTELEALFKEDFELFSEVFNINDFGYWEHDNYVLIQNQTLAAIASKNNIKTKTLHAKKKNWEALLFSERAKRSLPRLDDKCLTSWNAIMLIGFVDAYKALQNRDHLEIALKNANFIKMHLWSSDGHLWHNYKNGKTTIKGFLEDYCFVIAAFIALYEVTFDEKWLTDAKQLTDFCLEHFFDTNKKVFAFAAVKNDTLISQHFEMEDNVIPASNSVMANNLLQLSIYFENTYYKKIAAEMLQKVIPNIDYPSAYSNWLNAFLSDSVLNKELAICGENALEYARQINQNYHPNLIIAGTINNSSLPFLKNRFKKIQNLLYLCENKTCNLPTSDFEFIKKALAIK